MRQDQYERLQKLGEELMDVFLAEADPKAWPGAGMPAASMDAQTRGDRYWVKKNAAASGMLYTRVENMIGATQVGGGTTLGVPSDEAAQAEHETQLDAQIARAEKEAARLMADLQRGEAKSAFDKRVHGKA